MTDYPPTQEKYERMLAIIEALTTAAAVFYYVDALRVCRYCGNTEPEGHHDGCPVGAAKGGIG